MKAQDFSHALWKSGKIICFSALLLLSGVSVSRAEDNSWTKNTSGFWQEETSWSLGILPDSSQSVAITNAGEKTVTINSDTMQNFPNRSPLMTS